MKHVLVLTALLLSVLCQGQTKPPSPNYSLGAYEFGGQMLNMSTAYPSETNDTATSATLYLNSAYYNNTIAKGATSPTYLPVLYPVLGRGLIEFSTNYYLAAGTGTVTVVSTPQSSLDGNRWDNIPGVTSQTLTVTAVYNATVQPTSVSTFQLSDNYSLYYRIKHVVTGAACSIQSYWFQNKTIPTTN